MIGGVSSGGMQAMMARFQNAGGARPPGPDQDGSGGLNQTELEDVASRLQKVTGQSIDVDDILANFDSDGNGEIEKAEFKAYMEENGFEAPSRQQLSTAAMMRFQGTGAEGSSGSSFARGLAAYGRA